MTLIQIQDKLIAAELSAIRKHGNTATTRTVIYGARTRASKAIMNLGFGQDEAREYLREAADMVPLLLEDDYKV